jgi:chitinase
MLVVSVQFEVVTPNLLNKSAMAVSIMYRCLAIAVILLPLTSGRIFTSGFYPDQSPCPPPCNITRNGSDNWVFYPLSQLQRCANEPKLLNFIMHTPFDSPKAPQIAGACTAAGSSYDINTTNFDDIDKFAVKTQVNLQTVSWQTDAVSIPGQAFIALKKSQWLINAEADCSDIISFSSYGDTVVGVFVGKDFHNRGAALTLIESFLSTIQQDGISGGRLMQICDHSELSSIFGIIADTQNGYVNVHNAIRTWRSAKCVTKSSSNTYRMTLTNQTAWVMPSSVESPNSSLTAEDGCSTKIDFSIQASAAECRYIKAVPKDECSTLVQKCGITPDELYSYNPRKDLCSSIMEGMRICCSAGTLPDVRPKQQANGDCAPYTALEGDYCGKLGAEYDLTVAEIESFNRNKTWGWTECEGMRGGMNICLSPGKPPMPSTFSQAQCGPQFLGTKKPTNGTDISLLNQCPLKACCNTWAQCGVTEEYCTKSGNGAPGTAAKDTNGCISNCGTDIIFGSRPQEFRRVAYFEAFNQGRPCLRMDVTQIDLSKYNYIHFAFAIITKDYKVTFSTQDEIDQFKSFASMKGIKRIISFGGWKESTDSQTYDIFRDGMKEGKRDILATNVASIVKIYNLDGVDFDWEYPGAPDIPGIPKGELADGPNYLEFLKILRSKLAPEKSLSIAAPASFWYLKQFPLEEIGYVVDYIIYMTYDLHGQWDYGNKWAVSGCVAGNCLRSHVNLTETLNALSMITKAGVPSSKIVVGVSSYGRSFKMGDPKCYGPMCTFTGSASKSNAIPGRCTKEPGYISNAEIKEIIEKNPRVLQTIDADSNILVYGEVSIDIYSENYGVFP